jgi:hypothetical protein
MTMDLSRARAEVTASSAGGAPFLAAFGATLLATAVAGFVLPTRTTAVILLFQGNVALPLAFFLQRRLGWGTMSPDNPLKPLSIQLAMSQIAGLPVVILAFMLAPWSTAAAFASIGGAHFVPYAWLQRTGIYGVLGGLVSVGALAVTLGLREAALPWTLAYMGLVYWAAALLLYRRARALAHHDRHHGLTHAPAAA